MSRFYTFVFALLIPYAAHTALAPFADPLAARLEQVSFKLLGKLYTGDPLGEGIHARFDRDPRLRLDAFDCTTYVETVIATAKAKDPAEVLRILDSIRYFEGRVSFETRNHFPGIEWIANNADQGLLEDVTSVVDPGGFAWAEALIEKDQWYAKLSTEKLAGVPTAERADLILELRAHGKSYGKLVERLPYVKKERLLADAKLMSRIPHGAVINLVRPGWDLRSEIGTRLNISHQGFAFHKGDIVYFRHASKVGRVTEEPLRTYLQSRSATAVRGINVLKIY